MNYIQPGAAPVSGRVCGLKERVKSNRQGSGHRKAHDIIPSQPEKRGPEG